MEFKSLRNIESSFRQIRLFGIVFLSLCAVVTVWSVWNSYRFAEKGYYNRIIAGNINQVLKVDSVVCDFNAYPYRAVTYATQKIIRQSNVTERSLVTTCRLLNASRSDDNPNGFTIEGFTIIENKDLQTIKR